MSEEKPFYVYVHRRATDGRVFYVGKGSARRLHHKGRNPHWHNIVNKHGFTAHIVMRFENETCAFSFERALIDFYGKSNLCNLSDGGEGGSTGSVRTKEQREKYSRSKMGENNPMYKRVVPQEVRDKLSKALMANPPWKGKKLSEDHKLKLSESHKGHMGGKHHASRPIITGCGKEFDSIASAVIWLRSNGHHRASQSAISRCCAGHGKTAYGFTWRYA